MSANARLLPREVHVLAKVYHWPPTETLRLTVTQRRTYLMLIEAEQDRALLGDLQ
jgi:hypothetical protein